MKTLKDTLTWLSYFTTALSLVFLLLTISRILTPTQMDVLANLEGENDSQLISYAPQWTQFNLEQLEENPILSVMMYPHPDEEWVVWGIREDVNIPEDGQLLIRWSMTEGPDELAFNILDTSSNEFIYSFHEYWYYLLPNPGMEGQSETLSFHQFTYNTYQPFSQLPDGKVDLDGQIILEFSLDPLEHTEPIELNIHELKFLWHYPKMPLLASSLLWFLLTFWQLLVVRKLIFLNKSLPNIATAALAFPAILCLQVGLISLPIMSIEQPWNLMILPTILLLFLLLSRKFRFPLLEFHYLIYPILAILLFPAMTEWGLIFILFTFYIPFIGKDTLWKMIPVLLFILTLLIYRHFHNEISILLSFLAFLPFVSDLIASLLIEDSKIKEEHIKAQSLYRSILSNSSESILITSQDGQIITFNEGFKNWLPPFTVIRHNSYLEDILPEGYEKGWFDWRKNQGKTIKIRLAKSGGDLYYMLRCYPIHQSQDEKALQWFITDVTELQTLQQNLNKANKELMKLSQTDDLTGLANRRRFNHNISNEWNRSSRRNSPITLVIGDIDFFKQYNDEYGHLQGDDTLQRVAEVWRTAARRPYDTAARLGGEEFVLIFPDTEPEEILPLLKQMMDEMKKKEIPHTKSEIASYLTLSMGVTSCIPQKDKPWESLYQECDYWLYEAKKRGRNRIIIGQNRRQMDEYIP